MIDPKKLEAAAERWAHTGGNLGNAWQASRDDFIAGARYAEAELRGEISDIVSALKDVFKMMDEQILVRDISQDHLPCFTGRMMGIVTRLKFAHDALNKYERKSDE